jgi:hypothetical protein
MKSTYNEIPVDANIISFSEKYFFKKRQFSLSFLSSRSSDLSATCMNTALF